MVRGSLVTVTIAVLVLAAISRPARAQTPPTAGESRARRVAILARDARDSSDKRRLAAWEELLDLGEEGRRVLLPIAAAKLERDRKAVEERFAGAELARARRKVEEALVERRKEALACIFDRTRYPDENHGAVGQPEVNRLVDRVREAWDHPAAFTRAAIPEVDALASALEEDVVYVEAAGGTAPAEMPTVARWLDGFRAGFEVERLGISDSDDEWNGAVSKYHAEELLTSADPEELACMNATNEYRRMMGQRLLEIDERLVRAGRNHSEEMKELEYFAHGSPVKENASVGARCAHEGYPGGGAENIAWGMDGEGAFRAWYGSSGHHRNILGGHQQIGVGCCEVLWTQDFGGGSSLRGHRIEDPRILYLGRLKKLDPASAESEAALAGWCRSQKLEDLARLHAERALALDPKNEKARALLAELAPPPVGS